jgi:aryl carrier-like protein
MDQHLTIDDLRQAVATMIGAAPDDLGPDDNLVYLGLGSLEMMRLATRWRRAGIAVDFTRLADNPTLRAWETYLATTAAEGVAA